MKLLEIFTVKKILRIVTFILRRFLSRFFNFPKKIMIPRRKEHELERLGIILFL